MAQHGAVPGVDEDDAFEEEIDLLTAMWPDESDLSIERLTGEHRARISVVLAPHTAGEEHCCFVRCQLLLDVPRGYPHRPVRVALGTSRGLGDSKSASFISQLAAVAGSLLGQPALCALIQAAQEALTDMNAPSGDCPICLLELDVDAEADPVVRTPCYHAFHTGCLSSYWWTEWERHLQPLSLREQSTSCVSTAEVYCPECRARLPWPELRSLHSSLKARDAERRSRNLEALAEVSAETCLPSEPEQLEVLLPEEPAAPKLRVPSSDEVLLFEVVHPKGTCFRSRPRWSAKVANGQVCRGVHGVVAELVEGDTTYLRPEGSQHFLPVKGLSANIKLVHLEQQPKEVALSAAP